MILYSTNCPKCRILKSKLDEIKAEYTIVTDEEDMIKKGLTTVPVLELDNGQRLSFVAAMAYLVDIKPNKNKGKR